MTSSPFGGTLVYTIGQTYSEFAIGEMNYLDSLSVKMTQTARGISRGYSIVRESVSAAFLANEVNKLQQKNIQQHATTTPSPAATEASTESSSNPQQPSPSQPSQPSESDIKLTLSEQEEALLKEKIEKLSGHMFTVMWHVTEYDIKTTLKNICRRVVRDGSVDEKARLLRVQGLKILGDLFIANGTSLLDGLKDLKDKMHHQMAGTKFSKSPDDETSSAGQQPPHPTEQSTAEK